MKISRMKAQFFIVFCLLFCVISASRTSKTEKSVNSNPVSNADILLRKMMLQSTYQAHAGRRRRAISKRLKKDWKDHYLYPLYPIDYPVCEDAERESRLKLCEDWEKLGLCPKHRWILSIYCKKTCKFCKAASPPACHQTRFGCCWDNTIAKGPKYGEGCPRCFDVYPHTCGQFKYFCGRNSRNGRFIRYHCFQSCGRCHYYRSKRH